MSNQQPNAWQTASRSRHSHSASRTPQNRSGTGSPSQQNPPSQPPSRQDGGRSQQQQPQANNVWAQRSSSAGGANGKAAEIASSSQQNDGHQPVNGFNAADVKAFLGREVGTLEIPVYKMEGEGATRSSGGAWGAKQGHMANGQPFFVQLAKQVATLEGGG